MNGNTIYHVHFNDTDTDSYYGSMAAIFDNNDVERIGVSYQTLRNFRMTTGKAYKNAFVTIKKGIIIRKETNRKNPLKT